MALPKKIKDTLITVIKYNLDEREDYAEWCEYRKEGSTHIYEHIALLAAWLEYPNHSIEELQSDVKQHLDEFRQEQAAAMQRVKLSA